MADVQFVPTEEVDRTVVIYGNADENAAWQALLADSPVQVRNGEVAVGDRLIAGNGLATMFVRPRPGSDTASVVVFAGTGSLGTRTLQTISLFIPFVRYPDLMVFRGPIEGSLSLQVDAAGYFANDWSLQDAEVLWHEP